MRTTIVAAALLVSACAGGTGNEGIAAPPELAAGASECRTGEGDLRVMTRNLYLGGEIAAVAAATTAEDVLAASNAAWATVQATRFPERAAAIAREVEEARPDVLALQEVTIWRLGEPLACGPKQPNQPELPTASVVYQDFLAILLDALEGEGLHYEVAAQATSMDVELCIGDPSDLSSARDLRYTDREVILVRRGVAWRGADLPIREVPGFAYASLPPGPGDANGGLYAVSLDDGTPATACFPIPGAQAPVCSWRAWTAIEVEKGGRWVRVFETHVEDQLPQLAEMGYPPWLFQAFQDVQLLAIVDAAYLDPETALPTVVLGDFNVYVQRTDPTPPTYAFLTGGGLPLVPPIGPMSPLFDAWTALHPDDWGYTWGYHPDLRGGHLLTRLDLVLATPELTARTIERTGVNTRTAKGLRPSDHAGLFATFRLP